MKIIEKAEQILLKTEYVPKLDFFQTQAAIKLVKDTFEKRLAEKLRLLRVSAPRFLVVGTGLQDDLAGTQEPVRFCVKFRTEPVEVVHSLAKWKRHALGKHGFAPGTGLYTDMDAIRKDEDVDEIHSIYVDQWDWEKIISKEERTIGHLKECVRKIYSAVIETEMVLEQKFPQLKAGLPKEIKFVHAEELEEMYQGLTPRQREDKIVERYGAVFIIGIGHPLKSGVPHDLRAADYDDWTTDTSAETGIPTHGLDGDILVWDGVRKKALELSSMGIRVDKLALMKQLASMQQLEKKDCEFHKAVLEEKLPLTMGGGIGQSRLCMALLKKAHIGEVQSSVWPEEMEEEFRQKKLIVL